MKELLAATIVTTKDINNVFTYIQNIIFTATNRVMNIHFSTNVNKIKSSDDIKSTVEKNISYFSGNITF